jgi:hypothetical protein
MQSPLFPLLLKHLSTRHLAGHVKKRMEERRAFAMVANKNA